MVRMKTSGQHSVLRSLIVLLSAVGMADLAVARQLGENRQHRALVVLALPGAGFGGTVGRPGTETQSVSMAAREFVSRGWHRQ